MTDETTTGFTDPKVAWVTILTHDSYIMGVRVLCRSLQNTGTRFPLVVLYTDNISPSLIKILQKDGAKVKQLNIKHFPACLANQPGKIPVHNDICAKLCVWELTEYERVCFLDADVLVVRNMDELFEFNINADAGFSIGAVNKCSCTAEYADAMSVERMQERCAFTPMKIRNERNSPHISVDGAHRFSAACLLITPSLDEYKKLVRCALNNDDFLEHPDADCDIVNHYFEERIQSIPYFYNVAKSVQTYHSGLWCEIDLRSVHYTPEKPWEMNFKSIISTGTPVAQTYKWWWQVQEQLLAEEIIEHD